MSIVQKLTEGIVNRDMKQEGQALLNKWSQTGLLEGLQSDHDKHNMACATHSCVLHDHEPRYL